MPATDRRSSLGGSDAAAALGLSPWKSRVQLWLEKVGLAADDGADNEAMLWGRLLEQPILDQYAARTGRTLVGRDVAARSIERPWMTGTLDALAEGGRVVEAKTVGHRSAHLWGDAGTDQIPQHYLCQVMHYLAATGYEVADIAALIGGQELRIFEVPRNDALIINLVSLEHEFWRLVETETPPEPQTPEECRALWPQHAETRRIADDLIEAEIDALRQIKRDRRTLDDFEADSMAKVLAYMGEANALESPEGRTLATWRTQTAKRIDTAAVVFNYPDAAKSCTKITKSRVFRLKEDRE